MQRSSTAEVEAGKLALSRWQEDGEPELILRGLR